MPITLTDEMRTAFIDAAGWPGEPWRFSKDVEDGLNAVLAIAERDAAPDTRCTDHLTPSLRCTLPAGKHHINGEHIAFTETGARATWSKR